LNATTTTAQATRSPAAHRPPARGTQRGFSLVEAVVAIAVGAITLSTVAPGMRATIERRHLDGVAAQLAADLQYARSEAVARNQPVRMSFHADAAASCYLVHTGARALCSCAGGRPQCGGDAALLRGVAVDARRRLAVDANVASIAFDPLHGTATPAGTVRAVAGPDTAVRHVVNVLGRVRSCSPDGAVAGWRAC
jgi:type IV fimbrial biogenesis protein FimT